MASNRIKGITIEIGGDTTGLDKALKGINGEIKSTQVQLKDVERLLKLDPTNTELLQQKQRLLNKEVEQTKDKLDQLKEAQKQAQEQFDKGEITIEQYEGLAREIKSTEEYLKTAEKEAAQFNVTLAKVGATAGQIGDSLEKAAQKTRGLSAVGAGVAGGLISAGVEAAKLSDDLNTLAKQTGVSTEELQKMQYASDMIDVSVEDITGSLKKMKKNMDSTSSDVQEAWERIGVATKDANGEWRDSTEVFYDALEGLSKIENDTERDIVAMQLFGKSADQLAGIIDDGGAALKQYGDRADELGLILGQDVLDEMNEANDVIDETKAQLKATFSVLGSKVLENIAPVISNIAEKIGNVLEWVTNLNPRVLEVVLGIALAVAAISPLLSMLAGIAKTVQLISTVMGVINAIMIANPVGIAIVAITAAVTALFLIIRKHWDEIKPVIENIANWINEKVIQPIKKALETAFAWIKEHIIEPISNFIDKIKEKIEDIGLSAKNGASNKGSRLTGLAEGGVLSSGSVMVGESGPELLTLTQGKAVVQPLGNQGVDLSGLTSAIAGASAKSQNVTVQLSIDGKQFARAVYSDIQSEGARRGVRLSNA